MMDSFSFYRLWGLILKEFTQFLRDRSTFVLILALPIVQLFLFGLAINTNPRHLPTALINFDNGPFSRSLVQKFKNTDYFTFNHFPISELDAKHMMERHQVLFTLTIPPEFSRKLVRGERPNALLEIDGTDPVSVGAAVSATLGMMPDMFQYDLIGPLKSLFQKSAPIEVRLHTKYNPSALTQYNIVPGLLGVVLTVTFVMVASMALTRERERGTMETLLATPIRPIEVIIGKSIPFVLVGYLQVSIVLLVAILFFKIPLIGSPILLFALTLPFILANLSVGIMISTLANTQLEAGEMANFFFLPSMLLSGFAFPFQGMPTWAQWVGNAMPLTHFINIVRGIMLKGIGVDAIWVDLWPMLLFMFIMLVISVKRYRQTLD